MGMWESIVICLVFSIAVIAIDEYIHARRRRNRERGGATRVGH
jgi:hypothetical protein